jgi:NADH dehydrogenase [ubiquinone] 1 alpha subcomplex assembly factor 2
VETAHGAGGPPDDAFGTGHLFDSKHIGVEWLAWLSHRRPNPPTPEEIEAAERERAATRARAMAVDEEQARRISRSEAAAASGARESAHSFPKFVPQGAPPKATGGAGGRR